MLPQKSFLQTMHMKTQLNKYFLLILILGFILSPCYILAEVGGESEIKKLADEIKDKQVQIDELRAKIEIYQKNLSKAQSETNSLKNQIYILETKIDKKETEIKLNQEETEETNLEIKKTEEEIEYNAEETQDKKKKLGKLLRERYIIDQKNDLEIIILNESLSDFFRVFQTAETIQASVNQTLIELKELKKNLFGKQLELEEKKEKLNHLNDELTGYKTNLESQQSVKQNILYQTKNSEERYENMVNELRLEQQRMNSEIVVLEKTIRQKLTDDKNKLAELGNATFTWPVPSRYVTAAFHDPDYPFRYIFEHPGIDIRASQGTPLKASASGYVAKVQDGGRYGYSYIMLIHNDGFATVYGHLSKMYVSADQFVTQGEVIGATGGMPGTHGAGRLTTAPHLHFEIRKNGIPVNPLDYLP